MEFIEFIAAPHPNELIEFQQFLINEGWPKRVSVQQQQKWLQQQQNQQGAIAVVHADADGAAAAGGGGAAVASVHPKQPENAGHGEEDGDS